MSLDAKDNTTIEQTPRSPKRQRKRSKNISAAIPRKSRKKLKKIIVKGLNMKNGHFKEGQWDLLQPSDVRDAITTIKGPQKDDALENQLYDILDKAGDAQAIRQMWGEYFSNEESERNKIAKADAINDLVNYILDK